MSKDIIDAIIKNDLDAARTAVTRTLSEKATEALQTRKQVVASQYFNKKAE